MTERVICCSHNKTKEEKTVKNFVKKVLKFFEMLDEDYGAAVSQYNMDMDMHVWY